MDKGLILFLLLLGIHCGNSYSIPGSTAANPPYASVEDLFFFPRDCAEVYTRFNGIGTTPVSNRYYITPSQGQGIPDEVFCDFLPKRNYGYMYLSPSALARPISSLENVYGDRLEFMLRHLTDDGEQKETIIRNLPDYYAGYWISFSVHEKGTIPNEMYTAPVNRAQGPYVLAGLLPRSLAERKDKDLGYSAGSGAGTFQNFTFTNCDNNPNVYWAFFDSTDPDFTDVNYNPAPTHKTVMTGWIDISKSVAKTRRLPKCYYTFFEMHMGGCGGYLTPNNYKGVVGAAIGFRFNYDGNHRFVQDDFCFDE